MNTTHTKEPIEQKEKQKATLLLDELDLRDYFAAKAMQALIDLRPVNDAMVVEAYKVADAMLKAREA